VDTVEVGGPVDKLLMQYSALRAVQAKFVSRWPWQPQRFCAVAWQRV